MATWWVNQGSKKGKPQNKIVWSPLRNKRGASQWHWETMWDAVEGDKIYHYTNSFIVGESLVTKSAVKSRNPYPNNDMWESEGKLLEVDYTPYGKPIHKTKISADNRTKFTGKNGPFNANGDVQQGYFFPISAELETIIEKLK